MSIFKLLLAYINMMVPTPSEEWELHDAHTLNIGVDDSHYLIVHTSGKWYEKVCDEKGRPLYICNSDHYRYMIKWKDNKPSIKYKAPNGWKWIKLN
jgi:hypothetical protein